MEDYLTADIIQDFRDAIGDTSKSIPEASIISYLNTALRRMARSEGLERLFERHDTFELATINKDGTRAVSWQLGNKLGRIIDIRNTTLLKAGDSQVVQIFPKYMEYRDFAVYYPLPEQNLPGDPQRFTIEQIASSNRLIFNRPPGNLVAVDMIYSCFHPRITSPKDPILIDYGYTDYLTTYITILHKVETTDMSTARALYEDLDALLVDIKEALARQKTSLGYRRVKRSF